MFLEFTQHSAGEKEHGKKCLVNMDLVTAFGTIVDIERDNEEHTVILFENKETIDVREPIENITMLLLKMQAR